MSDEEEVIRCYCDDNDEDGLMFSCDKCQTWQHSQCVDLNEFTTPPTYTCPTCLGQILDCPCKENRAYQYALVCCTKCRKYQHKRHVGLGLGPAPKHYMCPKCREDRKYHQIPIRPLENYFPDYESPKKPQPLKTQFPPGRLYDTLMKITQPISPVSLITQLYNMFMDDFFQSHPFMHWVADDEPEDFVNISHAFAFYFVTGVHELIAIPTSVVMNILNHLINITLYRRPYPSYLRRIPDEFLPQRGPNIKLNHWSERSMDELTRFDVRPLDSQEVPKLLISTGPASTPVLITGTDLPTGAFICEIFGNVMIDEEIDKYSPNFNHNVFNITRTDFYIDSNVVGTAGYFMRFSRGFVSNCEIRFFKSGKDTRIGIFATHPVCMPTLVRDRGTDITLIRAGSELVLPFDFTPTVTTPGVSWTTETAIQLDHIPLSMFLVAPPPCQDALLTTPTTKAHQDDAPHCAFRGSALDNVFGANPRFTFMVTKSGQYPSVSHDIPVTLTPEPPLGKKGWAHHQPELMTPHALPWYPPPLKQKAKKKEAESSKLNLQSAPFWTIADDDFAEPTDAAFDELDC